MPHPFSIDEDIRVAATLPGRFYRDPALHEACRDLIFSQSWQLVDFADGDLVPQQVHPFTFLEGCVDEPLLLTCDDDDAVHCISNVCTHRGNLIVPGPCRTPHLRCSYHGRRFALDGSFRQMPEFEEATGFPTKADDLPNVCHERWGPFHFVAIDPAFALADLIRDVRARLDGMPLADLVFDPGRSRDYLVDANWALYCDNYLEGFHIPFVHAGLAAVLDYGAYRTELFRWSNLQVGIAEGGEDTFALPDSSPDHGQRVAGYYFWLFPNLMVNAYPWGISINIVKPLAVDRTKVSFRTWVWDPDRLDRGAGSALDRVEREDEAVVESVQRGIRSRLYDRGRYSPTREQAVHHFHRLVAGFVGEC